MWQHPLVASAMMKICVWEPKCVHVCVRRERTRTMKIFLHCMKAICSGSQVSSVADLTYIMIMRYAIIRNETHQDHLYLGYPFILWTLLQNKKKFVKWNLRYVYSKTSMYSWALHAYKYSEIHTCPSWSPKQKYSTKTTDNNEGNCALEEFLCRIILAIFHSNPEGTKYKCRSICISA